MVTKLRFNPDLFQIERWYDIFRGEFDPRWLQTTLSAADFKRRGDIVEIVEYNNTWCEPLGYE